MKFLNHTEMRKTHIMYDPMVVESVSRRFESEQFADIMSYKQTYGFTVLSFSSFAFFMPLIFTRRPKAMQPSCPILCWRRDKSEKNFQRNTFRAGPFQSGAAASKVCEGKLHANPKQSPKLLQQYESVNLQGKHHASAIF